MEKHLKLSMMVVGKELLTNILDYGYTEQVTIDATCNMVETIIPDVSSVPQDGDLTVIIKAEVDFDEQFNKKFEKVSKASLVKLIQNPLMDGLKQLNLASIGE